MPAETRQRLGWAAGLDLEVVEHDDAVTLRRRRPVKTLSPQQAVAEFRKLYQHEGAPVTLEQMRVDAARMASGEDQFGP